MGHIIRAYRSHPRHGRKALSQEILAGWVGITQAQLSRIENGPPIVHLDRLIQWAIVLKIPEHFLWFSLPDRTSQAATEGGAESTKRSDFLLLGGSAIAATLTAPLARFGSPCMSAQDCAQWLAWELWQHSTPALHASELPAPLAACLVRLTSVAGGGNNAILVDQSGRYSFAHPSFVDFFIAQRIFGGITLGDSELLASVQTSHDTDHVIQEFVSRDASCVDTLAGWMKTGMTPVLRVNSAGILAKLGIPDVADTVVTTLRRDTDTRQLYLTAVASRILGIEWQAAARLVAAIESEPTSLSVRLPAERAIHLARKFATEIGNPRDGAARWCSVLMLGQVREVASDTVSQALQKALREEPSRENLRAIGSVLGGSNPLTM